MNKWKIADGVTQSLLGQYMLCPRKFQYASMGLCSKESFAMTMGSFGHWYLGEVRKTNQPLPLAVWSGGQHDKLYPFPAWRTPEEIEFIKAAINAIGQEYLERLWGKDKAETEIYREAKLGDYLLKGKIDGIAGKSLMETKFKSRISEEAIELTLNCDWQVMIYLLLCPEVTEVIYDVIRYPQFSKKKPSEVYGDIKKDINKDPEHWFKSWRFEVDRKEVSAFGEELTVKLGELKDRKSWYRNQCACQIPYPCQYLKLCYTGKDKELITKPLFSELK